MSKTESFEFLNELALAFRRGEKRARPQYTPVLEGIRKVLAHLDSTGRLIPAGGMALTAEEFADFLNVIWEGRGDYSSRDRLREKFPTSEHDEARLQRRSALASTDDDTEIPTPAHPAEEETKAEGPRKFRKRPVEVEAMHLDNHTTPEQVARWCGGRVATPIVGTGCPIVIEIVTLEGVMTAHPGDWIIKGTQGEFYPCKPAPFADTFEPSDSPVVPAPTEDDTACVPAPADTSVIGVAAAALSAALDVLDPHESGAWEHTWRTLGDLRDCAEREQSASAPTETGPWQRIEDVPESVYLIKDCEGDKWRRDRKSWEVYSERGFRWHPGFPDRFTPFVAAEEG
ncbi:hypothetical protein ACWGK5_25665 [Rhodococcus qingshengii]